MSETDRDDMGSASDAPIVLVIGTPSQGYLEDNEVLQTIYGAQAPQLIILPEKGRNFDDFAWELFYPMLDQPTRKLMLLERFNEVAEKLSRKRRVLQVGLRLHS